MWGLREYRSKSDRLADHLPWAALIGPGIVLNKDGSVQTTIGFRGPDTSSATVHEMMANRAKWNNMARRLGSGWCLHVEASRSRTMDYPQSEFPNPIAQRIDDRRRKTIHDSPRFESTYYLTFTYLLPPDRTRKTTNLLFTQPDQETPSNQLSLDSHLAEFRRRVTANANILAAFMPEVRWLDDDETLSYLHDCVSERRLVVRSPDTACYLDEFLTDTPLIGGLSPRLGKRWLKVVSIRAFCNATTPCLLDALNELPLEYRWCVRFLPLDKDRADRLLETRRQQWFARRKSIWTSLKEFITKSETALIDTDSVNKANDVTAAREELGEDLCSFGHLTLTVTTWGDTELAAERNAQAIQQIVDSAGLVSRIEDLNSTEAWFGSLPGHAYADLRRPLVSSLNLCDLLPASSVYSGPLTCEHLQGHPLAHVETHGSTPFRLVLHQGDVGHTMVLGPTGAGKSTLLNFLAVQFLRYPHAQVYIFDKGGSCRAMTHAMGGEYYELSNDSPQLSFQPLGSIDQEGEDTQAHEWLIDIIQREGVTVTPAIKSEVWAAIKNLAQMSAEHRTLTTLGNVIQSHELRQAFAPYTLDGPYGSLLDADRDGLQYGAWQAFEMEGLMHSRVALLPVLTYLFHRLEQRLGTMGPDGQPCPTMLILDEAWLFLAESAFSSKIREWLKTLRKKNAAVVFATQSLADVASSDIAAAIIESCPTRIFLPNPAALEEHSRVLYEQFGLNTRQIANLQTAIPKREYYYQSPAGNRMFELGLDELALAFCGAGSVKEQVAIPGLLEAHGSAGFAEAYLRQRGLIDDMVAPGDQAR